MSFNRVRCDPKCCIKPLSYGVGNYSFISPSAKKLCRRFCRYGIILKNVSGNNLHCQKCVFPLSFALGMNMTKENNGKTHNLKLI